MSSRDALKNQSPEIHVLKLSTLHSLPPLKLEVSVASDNDALCKESILNCGRQRHTTRSQHQLDLINNRNTLFQTFGTRELAARVEFTRQCCPVVTIVRGDGKHRCHLFRPPAVRNVRGLRARIADTDQGTSPGWPGTLSSGEKFTAETGAAGRRYRLSICSLHNSISGGWSLPNDFRITWRLSVTRLRRPQWPVS